MLLSPILNYNIPTSQSFNESKETRSTKKSDFKSRTIRHCRERIRTKSHGRYCPIIQTFKGRHMINPAQAGVSFSLLFCGHLITSSPAYQWNGIGSMGAFIAGFGLFFLVPKVKRFPLVISFLAAFTLQTLFRAWLMKHHLPFVTLFFGTLTSPAFFLFTFFMITDPATSPKDTKGQIITGITLAILYLIYWLG